MRAARAGAAPVVKLLLAYGADPNAREGWRQQSALMWAAAEDHRAAAQALAETLLRAGANPNDFLKDGTSALTLAAMNAHWSLGHLLLDWGADPDGDAQGWGPLHQVALTRNPHHDNVAPQPIPTGDVDSLELARLLIAHGATVDLRTRRSPADGFRQWIRREGATAFFLAAKAADVALMRLLVASGADPLLPTTQGVTPLAAAAGVGYCQGESPGTTTPICRSSWSGIGGWPSWRAALALCRQDAMTNLLVSMLAKSGVPFERIGDSTGRLTDIEPLVGL
jgi:uncharacterized protein